MVQWRGSKRVRSSRAPVSFIDPCLPTRVDKAPSADGWAHEIKHDGYRLQIHVRDGRVRLFTMTGVDWTERFPRIVESASRTKGSAILDAEACVHGDDGVTDFGKLHTRGHEPNVIAYVFDVMMIDDNDVRNEPWSQRNKMLFKLLKRSHGGLLYSEPILNADGPTIYAHACKLGLEGIVSKRIDAPYRSGRVRTWVKTKNPQSPAALRIEEGTF
jgi:bifunctional non-homologous end joining protein LigD